MMEDIPIRGLYIIQLPINPNPSLRQHLMFLGNLTAARLQHDEVKLRSSCSQGYACGKGVPTHTLRGNAFPTHTKACTTRAQRFRAFLNLVPSPSYDQIRVLWLILEQSETINRLRSTFRFYWVWHVTHTSPRIYISSLHLALTVDIVAVRPMLSRR